MVDKDATPTGEVGILGSDGPGVSSGEREKLVPRGSSMDPEMKDSLPPLPRERLSMRSARKGRLITAPSDDNDSAVSMVSLSPLSNTFLLTLAVHAVCSAYSSTCVCVLILIHETLQVQLRLWGFVKLCKYNCTF